MGTIRHIATSRGARVAVGAFEREVQIWDLETRRRLRSLTTVLDFGGRRLAMTPDGAICFSGSYDGGGVLAQRVDDGEPIWHRRDIQRVQRLTSSGDGRRLYVGLEEGSMVLDARVGKTLELLRDVRDVFESADGRFRLFDSERGPLRLVAASSIDVERTTVAILDAAFGPTTCCISEVGGPVRCLDLNSGAELWRYQPRSGEHVLHLAYRQTKRHFVGVSRAYYAKMGAHTLFQLGSVPPIEIAELGNVLVGQFSRGGESLVLSDGRVVNVDNGTVRAELGLDADNN